MPFSGKLAKMADEQGISEYDLLKHALEATETDSDAARLLGVFPYTIKAAAERLNLKIHRKTVTVVERLQAEVAQS